LIFITLGEKGGIGKSATANHFLSAYLLKKQDDFKKKVLLYEFDAHNVTSKNIRNDKKIITKVVREDAKSLEDALAEIEFSAESNDIIIDVGGSENTYRFLKTIAGSLIAKNGIFIVPEVNQSPEGAENTILKIKNLIENPKIVLVLNRFTHLESQEQEFKFLYGNDSLGVKRSALADDKDIAIATLPAADLTLGLAAISGVSLWTMCELAVMMSDYSIEDKKMAWATEEDGKSIPCTLERYKEKSRQLNASNFALDTVDKASDLFAALDKYSDA